MKDVKRDKLRFVLLCLLLLCSVDSLTWTGQPANPTEAVEGKTEVLTWTYSLTADEQTASLTFFSIKWSKFNLSSLVFDRIASKTFAPSVFDSIVYEEPLSPRIVVDKDHKTDTVSLHINDVRRDDEGQYKIEYIKDFGGPVHADLVINLTVLVPPKVDYLTSDWDECENTTLILSCNATGKPTPNITWRRVASDGTVIEKLPAVNGVYVLNNTNRNSSGQYRCTASSGVGIANKTVNVTVRFAASINQIVNSSNTVNEDGFFSITCQASGNPSPTNNSYTWITKDGQLKIGSVLNFTSISRAEAGQYRCEVKNRCGIDGRNTTVNVYYPPEGIQFHVSEEEVCNGTTISFNCSAETANPMELSYQLYENDTMIGVISSTGVWSKTSWTGGGVFVYKCMVNNSVGTAMSSNVSVNVNVSSFIMPISTVVITEGGNLSLSCPATGTSPQTVFWVNTSNGEGTNGRELVIRNIRRSEAGDYRCEATNPCGNASESATIDVQYPPEGIQLHVSEEEVCNGTTISFNCSAETANPMELNYQLYENNITIGLISSTGVWSKTSWTGGGVFIYKCMVNNSVGTAMSSTVSVNVSVSSSIQTIPDKVVREGDNVTRFCNASGTPEPTVSWINVRNEQRTDGNKLMFENITRYKAGEYRCEATNPCGNARKSTAIFVHYAAEATGRGGNYSVREGSTELFSCPVDGNPEPTITWYKDNELIEPAIPNAKQLEAGETGCYTCSAINGLGPPVTITQCLIVEPEEPTPTGQPTNQVYAELTVKEEFLPEYRDLNNQVSKQLVDSFVSEMDKVYQNDSNYNRTEVTGLRSGSVIVSFTVYFKNSVTPNEGLKELQAAISNGTLGTYQVGNLILLPSGVSTFTSTTPRTAEPTDRPTWIIIVPVAAGVVLLALVVAFVTWWVHKKRKCLKDIKIHNSECEESLHGDSPHAKVNRAYAESGPPSASGTQGAARQQSQDLGAIPTYAVVDKSKKKKKKEEKPPIYATVDKSKKQKKKTDDKNLYDSVEEPKKEKKPGEVLYAELGDFKDPAMPQVSTSPATLPPLRRPPSYEQTQYADITAFLKGDATLPQQEGNEGSEMQEQSANQSQHDVDNKETPM